VHPIERLRLVARAGREDPAVLAQEAASALAAFSSESAGLRGPNAQPGLRGPNAQPGLRGPNAGAGPRGLRAGGPNPAASLVTACRALVARQPTCGPMWWLAARVLSAADPGREAWRAARELDVDPTGAVLAAALPDEATVVVLGWPSLAGEALARRGDVRALVVDALDEGEPLVRWLRRADADTEAEVVPESGLGAAVRTAGLVLLEAAALGAGAAPGLVAISGSAAAAATARQSGVPVWAVAGTGRLLPPSLWEALTARLGTVDRRWDGQEEIVPLAWVDAVAGAEGVELVEAALARATCPPAPELAHPAPR
jgi:hypothetical protein